MKKCIFCQFINKKEINHKEKTNYPLIPIYQGKEIFSFLSIPDQNKETHLLIIPKEHYEFIEEVPKKILSELITKTSKWTGILRKKYGGCHILLNNGFSAEQYIKHVHFHLIPKNKDKSIPWKNLSEKKFIKISNELKNISKPLKTKKN
jgi:diadenosine tetraphosphate (Ap4A) HIT family hydrolase